MVCFSASPLLQFQAEASGAKADAIHNIKSTNVPPVSKQKPTHCDEDKELNRLSRGL